MSETDELINRYLERMPLAEDAYLHDPTYHAQIHFMRRLLTAVDMAMADESVPEVIRVRVLRSAICGAPDEAEALARVADRNRRIEELSGPLMFTEWNRP